MVGRWFSPKRESAASAMCACDTRLVFLVFVFISVVHCAGGLAHETESGATAPTRQHFFVTCNSSTTARQVDIFDYDVLVVGAGLSGAVLAQQHAEHLHHRVLVLEKRNHTAGNTCVAMCYTYITSNNL